MTIAKSFGARLKKIRKQQGFSQERLSEISGLHRTYISSLERGARNPTLSTLYVLAEALDVEVVCLVNQEVGEGQNFKIEDL